MSIRTSRFLVPLLAALAVCLATSAEAQVVYYGALRPVVAAPVVAAPMVAAPAYVSNYVPAGNYAAVTAYSPPVYADPAGLAVRVAYPPAPVAVTSYYAAAPVAPVVATSYYAPAPVVAAAPVIAAPVTTYYAPAAVAVPVYRRGPFGGLRPVRSAYYLTY